MTIGSGDVVTRGRFDRAPYGVSRGGVFPGCWSSGPRAHAGREGNFVRRLLKHKTERHVLRKGQKRTV